MRDTQIIKRSIFQTQEKNKEQTQNGLTNTDKREEMTNTTMTEIRPKRRAPNTQNSIKSTFTHHPK